jgi:hypothetical protein
MRGVIPVYDVTLAAAYEVGVSNMGSVNEGVTREDFKTPEVCGLLSAGGELRTLGLHILYQFVLKSRDNTSHAGPSAVLELLLSVGVLPLLCSCANKISDALLEESEDFITPLLSDMGLLSDILALCCSEQILPPTKSHYISTIIHFRWLASAAANMLIDAIDESGRGTAISSTELSIAVDLHSSWQWLSSRPNNISGECQHYNCCLPAVYVYYCGERFAYIRRYVLRVSCCLSVRIFVHGLHLSLSFSLSLIWWLMFEINS